jgi:hypothetical protein
MAIAVGDVRRKTGCDSLERPVALPSHFQVSLVYVVCHHHACPQPCVGTYAVVDDAERDRVLFAGLDGVIRSLELASGQVAEVLSPPATPAIIQMQLVGGNLLFCLCQPGFPETRGKRQQPLLQIWDLDKLTE